MNLIFEYPSLEQSESIKNEYDIARKMKSKFGNYSLLSFTTSLVLLTATFAVEKYQMLFFTSYILAILATVFFIRCMRLTYVKTCIFLSAYIDRMEIVKYNSDLLGREEVVVYYDDIIRGRFTDKRNTQLVISFYETEKTYKVAFDSKGENKILTDSRSIILTLEEGSDLQLFFTEIAPTLFDIKFKNRKEM